MFGICHEQAWMPHQRARRESQTTCRTGPCVQSVHIPGLLKVPNIMARYPKIESIGSIESIILGIWEVQVKLRSRCLGLETFLCFYFGVSKEFLQECCRHSIMRQPCALQT